MTAQDQSEAPFFVIEDVIASAKAAICEAHKRAGECADRGDLTGFTKHIERAAWYERRLATDWRETPDLETEQ